MTAIEPRWEFRIWGDSLEPLRRSLGELCAAQPAAEPERSCETYVVSDATDETNAKIRAGAIDIKVLLRAEHGLEQWRPELKSAFPIDAPTLAQVFASLRVDAPPMRKQRYDANAFIDELIVPHPRLAAAEVRKLRWRFLLDGCAAEFTEAAVARGPANGAVRLHSVAIESADSRSVFAVIARLRIGDRANVSYVRQIKSVLGRTPSRMT